MCLAMPVLVLELTGGDQAIVALGDVRKEVSLALVEEVQPGDYVILHAGYALQKLDRDEADRTLALFAALAQMEATLSTSTNSAAQGPLAASRQPSRARPTRRASTASWSSAAATRMPFPATASPICCPPASASSMARAARYACCRWDASTARLSSRSIMA